MTVLDALRLGHVLQGRESLVIEKARFGELQAVGDELFQFVDEWFLSARNATLKGTFKTSRYE